MCKASAVRTILVWLKLLTALCSVLGLGCSSRSATPRAVTPQADAPLISADEMWSALARLVEDGTVKDTDTLLLVVDRLKERGILDDVSRVDQYRSRNEKISDENRRRIADSLR